MTKAMVGFPIYSAFSPDYLGGAKDNDPRFEEVMRVCKWTSRVNLPARPV